MGAYSRKNCDSMRLPTHKHHTSTKTERNSKGQTRSPASGPWIGPEIKSDCLFAGFALPSSLSPAHFKNLLDERFCAIKKGSSHQRTTNNRRKAVMKRSLVLLVAATLSAQAAQIRFALSPPGTDAAVGLSPSNEVPAVTNSTGSGNIVGPGIVFDTDTSILHLSIGYGSDAGFTDLTGVPVAMHIHSPASPGHEADVLTNLSGFNMPAADPTKGGLIQGSLDYPTNSIADLLAGLAYIN